MNGEPCYHVQWQSVSVGTSPKRIGTHPVFKGLPVLMIHVPHPSDNFWSGNTTTIERQEVHVRVVLLRG